jgi:hypothetical protein
MMLSDFEEAQSGGKSFDVEKHVQSWPVKSTIIY